MGMPLDTCALGMLEWLPQNPECERLALELEVMLGHAMIADRGYAASETRTIRLRANTRVDDLTDPSQKFPILMGFGPATMSETKAPSRGTQPWSSLPSRTTAEYMAAPERSAETQSPLLHRGRRPYMAHRVRSRRCINSVVIGGEDGVIGLPVCDSGKRRCAMNMSVTQFVEAPAMVGRNPSLWRQVIDTVIVGPPRTAADEIAEYLARHQHDLSPTLWIELERRHVCV